MNKLPENKDENYEGLKEQVEEIKEKSESGTTVPAESRLPEKSATYIVVGVVFLTLILFVIAKMRKRSKTKEVQPAEMEEKEVRVEEKTEMKIAYIHEQGAREDQQDSFGVSDFQNKSQVKKTGILLTVADGMGGLTGGGKISSLAVTTCQNLFHHFPEYLSAPDMLLEMAAQVNLKVNQFLAGKQKGGSTLVLAIIRENNLYFLTIGDSRIYLYRDGVLIWLNREHIYKEELALMAVNGMVPVGRISMDSQAKALTSYIGNGSITHLDRNTEGIRLKDKDRILLASDGVFGTLIPEQLEKALALPTQEAADKIREMVEEAQKPYQDNYTAVIFEYRE